MSKVLNMPQISHDEIRHRILEILYRYAQQNPSSFGLGREAILEVLKIPEETVHFNMLYLEEKGLVRLSTVIGGWLQARITAFGIDVVENKARFSEEFPFIKTTIQEIHGDVYGDVVQAIKSQVTFEQQVTNVFQQARDMIKVRENIRPTLKEEIMKHVNLLEKELKRKEPDAGRIQRLWKWLRRNASWVVPTLAHVVLEGLKTALGE